MEMQPKLIDGPVKHKTRQACAGMGKKEANGLLIAQGTSSCSKEGINSVTLG